MRRPRSKCLSLSKSEYNILVKAGYQLEPYKEMCIVKSNDPFYREETKEMLKTAREILRERKKKKG